MKLWTGWSVREYQTYGIVGFKSWNLVFGDAVTSYKYGKKASSVIFVIQIFSKVFQGNTSSVDSAHLAHFFEALM